MKNFILLGFLGLIFFGLLPSFGYAQSVSLANVTTPAIGGGSNCKDTGTSNCKDLVTDVGDGTGDSPHVVYVPIYNANSDSGHDKTTRILCYIRVQAMQLLICLLTTIRVQIRREILLLS